MRATTCYGTLLCLLLLVVLIGTGCTSTKPVKSDGRPHRAEINEKAEGNTAKVTLRNGEKLKLKNFRIDADSASGLTEVHSVSLATSRIKRVKFTNRWWPALKWGGGTIGLGVIAGLVAEIRVGTVPWTAWAVDGATVSPLPAGIAALSGSDQTYLFERPPNFRRETAPAEKKKRVIAESESDPPSQPSFEESNAKEASISPSIVDTQIPRTSMKRPDDIAVVIGNTEYENDDVPNVDYAVRDANIMKKYLTRTLGFREENIIYLDNAGGSTMERVFGTGDDPNGQLYDYVRPGESSVFVYYSGHGAPNPESGNAYLLPSDANPSYLSQNGYPLNQLYENLSKMPAESVTVVLEACFSGTSEGGAVVQNASPAVLSVENPVMGMENGLALTAGAADQVASWYSEKKHGLFTYYFLKGLRGNADANSDKTVTAKEMESYLNDKVPYRAQRMHSRKQTPVVVGRNKGRVLVDYEGEVPAN